MNSAIATVSVILLVILIPLINDSAYYFRHQAADDELRHSYLRLVLFPCRLDERISTTKATNMTQLRIRCKFFKLILRDRSSAPFSIRNIGG